MAKCEEGYACDVCGEDVADLRDSDLYLRFVLGMLDPETLHTTPERHLRCNPALAQFIVDDAFPPIAASAGGDGSSALGAGFDKASLDPAFVAQREAFVTRGWRRLQELFERLATEELSVLDYPLPEVAERLRREAER